MTLHLRKHHRSGIPAKMIKWAVSLTTTSTSYMAFIIASAPWSKPSFTDHRSSLSLSFSLSPLSSGISVMPSAPILDVSLTLGALEIGCFCGLVLFGVLVTQGYVYFQNYATDGPALKLLVVTIMILELLHSFTASLAIYHFTISLAGTPIPEMPANSYAMCTTGIFENLITVLVQGFFALRVRQLSGKFLMGLVCWLLSILRFAAGIAFLVESYLDVPQEPDDFKLVRDFDWLITTGFSIGAFTDVVITILLCRYLTQWQSPHNLNRTSELLDRLIKWVIQTGLITSVTSVVVIVSFQLDKRGFVWLGFYTILAKLYSNSLLLSLNVRSRHRAVAEKVCSSSQSPRFVFHSDFVRPKLGISKTRPASDVTLMRVLVTATENEGAETTDSTSGENEETRILESTVVSMDSRN